MIFLERMKSRLTAAIMLKDVLGIENMAIGDVYLKVQGISKSPLHHSTGYFLVVDVTEGTYEFTAGGNFYMEKVYQESLKTSQMFYNISLEPKANYPFTAGITVLKGRVTDQEDKPVSGASIKVKGMTESALTEDNGSFFIRFKTLDADKSVVLDIKKEEYTVTEADILLINGITSRIRAIKLTKK